jgi:hypothetical protein
LFERRGDLPRRPVTPSVPLPGVGDPNHLAPLLPIPAYYLPAPRVDAAPRQHHEPQFLAELRHRGHLARQARINDEAELQEVKERSRLEQHARTVDRIGRLFTQSPPSRKQAKTAAKTASPKQEPQSSSSVETFTPLVPRQGKATKYYSIHVGRQVGVVNTWDECKALVDGVRAAEFRSFHTAQEANEYVRSAKIVRKVNYMNLKPSSFVGGRSMRATVQVIQEGEARTQEYLCCLDSASDVNLAKRHLLHDVRRIESEAINNCGDETRFTEEGTLRLFVSGSVRELPALAASKAQLPFECEVSLGVPGVDDLGIRLDDHRARKKKRLECHVGEKTLRTWWEVNGSQEVVKVSFDIDEVEVNPDLPDDFQRKVRRLLEEFRDVFAGEQSSLPKPFAADPVELKFVEDPKPQTVPEPRWTYAQKQILTSWAEEGLRNKSLELSTSRWASPPRIVMKTPAHTHKDLVDVGKCKLRVCGDYRVVNMQIVKIVPNLPNGLEEVEKAAGHEY